MADNNGNTSPPGSEQAPEGGGKLDKEPNELSLEQALLAPLNSILKAQLHSARSFLNLLLQLGYPHHDGDEGSDKKDKQRPGEPYHLEFRHYDASGNEQTLRVAALSLVPIAPLAIDTAVFEMEMAVRRVTEMQQMQMARQKQIQQEEKKENPDARPWFLVDKPVSIQGTISPSETVAGQQRNESQSSLKINELHLKIKRGREGQWEVDSGPDVSLLDVA